MSPLDSLSSLNIFIITVLNSASWVSSNLFLSGTITVELVIFRMINCLFLKKNVHVFIMGHRHLELGIGFLLIHACIPPGQKPEMG